MKKIILGLIASSALFMNASFASCESGDIEVNCIIHQFLNGNYSGPSESFKNCLSTSAIATYDRTHSRFKVDAGVKLISSPGNSAAFITFEDKQKKVRSSTVVSFNVKAKNKLDRRFSTVYRSWDDKIEAQVYCDAQILK